MEETERLYQGLQIFPALRLSHENDNTFINLLTLLFKSGQLFSVGMETPRCIFINCPHSSPQVKCIHFKKQGRGELSVADLWDVYPQIPYHQGGDFKLITTLEIGV